ncbi:MAG: glycosyltransferase [Chitinophagaceae bacterium]
MKTIYFTVTNDLSYDQRMIRICTSVARNGYEVVLVGRLLPHSIPVTAQPFRQKRIRCIFTKGKFFYLEFNLRLLIFLLFRKMACVCAIDLDTIVPCLLASALKKIPRVYDAHELFCEMQEIVTRPGIYKAWKMIERWSVPKFVHGYTVNEPIAEEFKKIYGVEYEVIRSIARLDSNPLPASKGVYILYQGSVNEGRSFETLIPAMKQVNSELWICGDGNFMSKARELVAKEGLEQRIFFKGRILPSLLKSYTLHAAIGITLFEKTGLSNYLSLANRFFDYMHAGIPQVCVNYPAYKEINNKYEIAVLLDNLDANTISSACNRLLLDETLYARLQANCLKAREHFNWQQEEKKLVAFYKRII